MIIDNLRRCRQSRGLRVAELPARQSEICAILLTGVADKHQIEGNEVREIAVVPGWLKTGVIVLLLGSVLAQPARMVAEACRFPDSSARTFQKPVSRPLVRLRFLPSEAQHPRVRTHLAHALPQSERATTWRNSVLRTSAGSGVWIIAEPRLSGMPGPLRC
jgi:hypothetical protein